MKKCKLVFLVQSSKLEVNGNVYDYETNEEDFVVGKDAPAKRSFVESTCKCAMSDKSTGFCSSVIGTEFYQKAVRAEKYVLSRSECHTIDRHNLRA